MGPTEADWVEALSIVAVLAFMVLVMLGFLLSGWRIIRYRREKRRAPMLLKLGAVERFLLGFSFILILVSRALVATEVVEPEVFRDKLWWVVLTSLPALIAAGMYVWAEIFLIERELPPDDSPARKTTIESDDASST